MKDTTPTTTLFQTILSSHGLTLGSMLGTVKHDNKLFIKPKIFSLDGKIFVLP